MYTLQPFGTFCVGYIDRSLINSEVHNYNTRSSQNSHSFNTRTPYGQRCIKGSLLWNSLPMPLRLCSSITVF